MPGRFYIANRTDYPNDWSSSGMSDGCLWLVYRRLRLSWIQRICLQSKPLYNWMGFGTREKMADPPPINPAVGVTASERYLGELCKRSFLFLWSYPGIPSHQLEQVVSVMGHDNITIPGGPLPEKRRSRKPGIRKFPHSEKTTYKDLANCCVI